MRPFHNVVIGVGYLIASTLLGCTRPSEGQSPGAGEKTGSTVREDVKGVAKATEKTAKDIGHATADLADKAGKSLQDIKNTTQADGEDALITTKVKSQLTGDGFDPLHVHVDTAGKVVTLSGSVESAAKAQKAVALAKAVSGVAKVQDHLFVKAP